MRCNLIVESHEDNSKGEMSCKMLFLFALVAAPMASFALEDSEYEGKC